jgi:IS5 family transposase
MRQVSRFTEAVVPVAQRVTGDGDESAAPDGGGGFADYPLVSLHCLRISLDTSYRMTIDLLKEMPQITGEIGRVEADLPAPSTLCKALDRIEMSLCRVLLRQSAQLHDPSEHAALDATFYDRDRASRHCCHRTNYRVQTLKTTKLVDTESQAVLDVHCSTTLEGSDADLCEQIARRNAGDLRTLAADKGYDENALREQLRELEIRPLIKHCVRAPYDHAHNARIDEDLYVQRSMTETVNSAVKRSLGYAVRARG